MTVCVFYLSLVCDVLSNYIQRATFDRVLKMYHGLCIDAAVSSDNKVTDCYWS